jgi:hypothetical protein
MGSSLILVGEGLLAWPGAVSSQVLAVVSTERCFIEEEGGQGSLPGREAQQEQEVFWN